MVGAAFCPEGYGACQGTRKEKRVDPIIHLKKQEQNTLSAGVIDMEIKVKRLQRRNGLCQGPIHQHCLSW